MEILQKFGIDPLLFIAQLVNFLVLIAIFRIFLYKPLLAAIKERQDRIRTGLADAENARIARAQAEREKEEILHSTRIEAQSILDDTRTMAETLRQELLVKSRAEADKLLQLAQAQAALEMTRMEKQVKMMSVDLSQKVLQNVIATLFTQQDKERIMQVAVEKMNSTGGANETH